MLSRVANSIYWMSRYIERAENVARFMDVTLSLSLDMPGQADTQWRPLVDVTGDTDVFLERYGVATQKNVVQFLTFDTENPNSILSCLRAARDNARSVREIISSEMWQQVNEAYLFVSGAVGRTRYSRDPQELFASVKTASHLFTGITDATMTHNEGWHFSKLGRKLERADKTSRIIDVKYFLLLPAVQDVGTTVDDVQWAAVLKSASAFEMYRKKHGRIQPAAIVEFLLFDKEFPRAVHYCLNVARESMHAISGTPMGMFRSPAEQLMGAVCSELAFARVDAIIAAGLHEYLDQLQTSLNAVGQHVAHAFFGAPAPGPAAGAAGVPRI